MKTKLVVLAWTVAIGLLVNADAFAAQPRVMVWSEGTAPKAVYPNDINGAVAEGLACLEGWEVVKASLDDPDQGLSDERLNGCDVLVWWGHQKHGKVKDELVKKIVRRVKENGMGFISLHSAHFAKPNITLMSQSETSQELLAKVQPKGCVAAWGAYKGKMFYFQAGHETNPVFFDANIRKIIANAVRWAAPGK